MIVFNWTAVGLAVVGLALALLFESGFPGHGVYGVLLFVGVTAGLDVLVRRSAVCEPTLARRLFLPWRGGHVFFVPLWLWGAGLFPLMCLVLLTAPQRADRRRPVAPPPAAVVIHRTQDPKELAEARQLAADDSFEQELESYRRLAADRKLPARRRLAAVDLLFSRGQRDALSAVRDLEKAPAASDRREFLLTALRWKAPGFPQERFLEHRDEALRVMAAGMPDPGRPGWRDKLERVLDTDPSPKVREAAAEGLNRLGGTPASVEAARKRVLADPDTQSLAYGLTLCLASPDPEVREAALLTLMEVARRPKHAGWHSALSALCTVDDPRVRKLYLDLYDPVGQEASSLLPYVARALGEDGLPLLLQSLRQPALRTAASQALSTWTGGSRGLAPLRAALAQERDPRLTSVLAYTLHRVGGPKEREALEAALPRLDPDDRAPLQRALDGHTLRKALQRLVDLGLLARMPPAPKEADPWPLPYSVWEVEHALEESGRALSFDAESDEIPSPHHQLLSDLAGVSGGAFHPEYASQLGDGDRETYLVRFVHGGTVYGFEAANLGDWYDVDPVLAAANAAVADSGATGRFVALASDGQAPCILFGDPQKVALAAGEGLLRLEESASAAYEAGMEAEERLREELRRQGREGTTIVH